MRERLPNPPTRPVPFPPHTFHAAEGVTPGKYLKSPKTPTFQGGDPWENYLLTPLSGGGGASSNMAHGECLLRSPRWGLSLPRGAALPRPQRGWGLGPTHGSSRNHIPTPRPPSPQWHTPFPSSPQPPQGAAGGVRDLTSLSSIGLLGEIIQEFAAAMQGGGGCWSGLSPPFPLSIHSHGKGLLLYFCFAYTLCAVWR